MDDRDWIAETARRLERPLLAYVAGFLGDRDRGRDVVQEAFLELCRRTAADVGPRVDLWLFTVCRNRAIDILRKEQRMTPLAADPPSRSDGPADALETKDAARAVLARVARLPDPQREAVRLRFQNEFSYKEIAAVMGLSESHVGVLLHTAMKTLRASFPDLTPSPRSAS